MVDHQHTCVACGFTYDCHDYNLKDCKSKGVLKAASVNGQGPYCEMCRQLIMAVRIARGREISIVHALAIIEPHV